jgi:hypothetical protein
LVLALHVVLLGGYTLGCHSLRHAVGVIRDKISGNNASLKLYKCVCCLNKRHMLWALMSLIWVGFSDVYIRMCALGIWTDWKILI